MLTLKLQGEYFDKIKSGEKIYEIRINDEKRQAVDVGDILVLLKEPQLTERLNVLVRDIVYFDSFAEMVATLPKEKVGFKGKSNEEMLKVYRGFYPLEQESKYGVVAFKIEVLK